jgi:hypothetical protein
MYGRNSGNNSSYPKRKFLSNKILTDKLLELIQIVNPKIIYRRRNRYFFAYDGFMMYCDQCTEHNFSMQILDATEFSNVEGSK